MVDGRGSTAPSSSSTSQRLSPHPAGVQRLGSSGRGSTAPSSSSTSQRLSPYPAGVQRPGRAYSSGAGRWCVAGGRWWSSICLVDTDGVYLVVRWMDTAGVYCGGALHWSMVVVQVPMRAAYLCVFPRQGATPPFTPKGPDSGPVKYLRSIRLWRLGTAAKKSLRLPASIVPGIFSFLRSSHHRT